MLHSKDFDEYKSQFSGESLDSQSVEAEYLTFLQIPDANSYTYGIYCFSSFDNYELFQCDTQKSILRKITSPNIWFGMISNSHIPKEERIVKLREQVLTKEINIAPDRLLPLLEIFQKLEPPKPRLDYNGLPENCTFQAQLDGESYVVDFPLEGVPSRLYWDRGTADIYIDIVESYCGVCEEVLNELRNYL